MTKAGPAAPERLESDTFARSVSPFGNARRKRAAREYYRVSARGSVTMNVTRAPSRSNSTRPPWATTICRVI